MRLLSAHGTNSLGSQGPVTWCYDSHFVSDVSSSSPNRNCIQEQRCFYCFGVCHLFRYKLLVPDLDFSTEFELAVVIPSARSNFELRRALRDTWFGDVKRRFERRYVSVLDCCVVQGCVFQYTK